MKTIYISIVFFCFALFSYAQSGVTMIINNGGQPEIYEHVDSITFPDYKTPFVIEQRGEIMFPYFSKLKSSYQLSTWVEEITLNNDFNNNVSYKIMCYDNSLPQTIFVHDEENVYMLAREIVHNPFGYIYINEHSSALAMVTMHPLLSPIVSTKYTPLNDSEYDTLIKIVTRCNSYSSFEEQVAKAIKEGRSLFDDTNDALISCLNEVIEEICECFEEPLVSYNTGSGTNLVSKRALGNEKMYPFYSELNGNVLTLRNTGLTPSYYGTVTHSEGKDKIAVLTRADYGIMDMCLSANEAILGPKCNYTFSHIGSYQFYLSRMGPQAVLDFYVNIVNSILSGIGLEEDTEHILDKAKLISNTLAREGIGVYTPDADFSFVLGMIYENILKDLIKNGSAVAKKRATLLLSNLNLYNKYKAGLNTAARIVLGFSAPQEVSFTLNYDGNSVDPDFVVVMEKVDGDNQFGKRGEQLPINLKIKVRIEPEMECKNLRIKFSVYGGGQVGESLVCLDDELCASTSWTLGVDGSQRVRATLYDIITGKNLSSVIFNADIALDLSCPDNHHPHIIDLGLPSGQKWACCNVGAKCPEEYGGLYSWGETDIKESYYQTDYKHYKMDGPYYRTIIKYSTKEVTVGQRKSIKDDKTILEAEDDAATVHMGEAWRMPTQEEMRELKNNCSWSRIDSYNIKGMLVTGPNGNMIFLPAGGMIDGSLSYSLSYRQGTLVMYWGRELSEADNGSAWILGQSIAGNILITTSDRHRGLSIRGVCSDDAR